MSELTDRGKAFRTAITGFIEARREAKLKGKDDDADTASKYDYATWLADAASRAHNLRVVTHPIKFTHSGIKGASSVHMGTAELTARDEIGTHSLAVQQFDFAISDAKHLDVYSFLKEVVDGKRLLEWLHEDDADLTNALDDNPAAAAALMKSFRQVLQPDDKLVSSTLAKQIYWLKGEDPTDDGQYHLLQPMFSSSLEQVVHEDIRSVREGAFAARGTRKQKPTFADHSTYLDLVARTIGGSNAQNVSPQNKARGGVNYLLASLPPPAWKPRDGVNLFKLESVFDDKRGAFILFEEVRQLVRGLADFLKANPDQNKETRERVTGFLQDIAEALSLFGADARARGGAGWTRNADFQLPPCEQLWLDPERTELPLRDDPEHPHWREDDVAFNQAYQRGDWADEVAMRFGLWLNGQLRKRSDKLAMLGEAEMRHFARHAILDVAWPIPLQRRAKAGAA
ncbi:MULTISPECIES: type I-F CRISPR-associated protein Csy1 [Rhodanobacter]|uniref:type I-F CRISPR-associated protein Csy1 n=1 Tax=Rhodanobacter TaxID=75309 RepID=UPI0004210769|nr:MULTISPECIES: type I-F CRISPR-associated protein Csy1 [Rhodanobacter]TAN15454.1 MAG: type I-F CRISPR-associated protein Csy1 [Rhodanobacter sp.]UJJ55317.1 type I-F CRISPR-associated protein Csy1 [Rhodanobacter thiooxydans]